MMRRAILFLIREVYQRASGRILPKRCKYMPTCSEYTAQAVERYGAARGVWMGFLRVLRCNPFAAGGEDPVR